MAAMRLKFLKLISNHISQSGWAGIHKTSVQLLTTVTQLNDSENSKRITTLGTKTFIVTIKNATLSKILSVYMIVTMIVSYHNGTAHLKKCEQLFEYQHLLLLRDIQWSKLQSIAKCCSFSQCQSSLDICDSFRQLFSCIGV
jgi:hypothetical protein